MGYIRNPQNDSNTNLVLLRLGLFMVAQTLRNRWGITLYRYPMCDTSGEIITTYRGPPSFVHAIKTKLV